MYGIIVYCMMRGWIKGIYSAIQPLHSYLADEPKLIRLQ